MDDVKKALEEVKKLREVRQTVLALKENPKKAANFTITFKNKKQITVPFTVEAGVAIEDLVNKYVEVYYKRAVKAMEALQEDLKQTYGDDLKHIKLDTEVRDLLK